MSPHPGWVHASFPRASVFEGALIAEDHNNHNGAGTLYIGRGVGIFAKDGVYAREVTMIRDNSGRVSGGGIFTPGFLNVTESTVSGNYGVFHAVIYASGDVEINHSR